ncbi:MAG: hypothetical protein SV422_03115 [Pseudomonadota bacterium]|nr:hypothetical protein [Pseudomonadota bacterium]
MTTIFTRCTCLVTLMLLPLAGQGTTRLILSLDELIENSPIIFTGTVEDIRIVEEGDVAYSLVSFAVSQVVKGDPALRELELRFVGGDGATIHTEVSGQFIPIKGANGLWFVDDASRALVNPLTGWSQGYFPIVEKADGTRWLDLQDHPDYGILAPAPPLAGKMRAFNVPSDQIAAQFPHEFEYPVDDFVAAIMAREPGLGR